MQLFTTFFFCSTRGWAEEGGVKGLSFPLLEDVNGVIAEKYGVLGLGRLKVKGIE